MASSENQLNSSLKRFGSELYQYLRNDGGNLVVSPLGIQVLLALLLEGADGKTAKEIANTLHHSKNNIEILQGYKAMLTSLESPSLKFATSLFADKNFEIKANYKTLISEYFLSEIIIKDICENPEESRVDINHWVKAKTNFKVKELLPPGSINVDAGLLMINAVHFYAKWKMKFDSHNTNDMPFHVNPKKNVNVKMMFAYATCLFMESKRLDAKIVKLPYEDEKYAMVIVLPNEIHGLPKLEKKLLYVNLFEELGGLNHNTINLMLPKFQIEKTMDLSDWFSKQMPTAYSDNANLSGITDDLLRISKIIQKAFVEVNEVGTEATAGSAVVMATRSMKITHDMKCDHPFYFIIIKDKLILFHGAVVEPDPEKHMNTLSLGVNRTTINDL